MERTDGGMSSCCCLLQHRNACISPLSLRRSPQERGENANKATSKRPKLRGKNKNVWTKPHSGLSGRRTKRLAARRWLGSRLESSSSVVARPVSILAPPSSHRLSSSFDFLPLKPLVPMSPLHRVLLSIVSDLCLLCHRVLIKYLHII